MSRKAYNAVIEELKLLASNIKSGVNIYPKLCCDPKANDIIHKFASRFNMCIQAWFVKLNYWISKMSQEEKEMYNLSQSLKTELVTFSPSTNTLVSVLTFEMEYRNPPKKSKRQSTLTLNKKGSRYYSRAKAEQSQTTSAESVLEMYHSLEATDLVEVTHPVDLSTNIFASQSEHSENLVQL